MSILDHLNAVGCTPSRWELDCIRDSIDISISTRAVHLLQSQQFGLVL